MFEQFKGVLIDRKLTSDFSCAIFLSVNEQCNSSKGGTFMIRVEFDGSYEPANCDTARIGVIIWHNNAVIFEVARAIGNGKGMSNNVAEYAAAKTALEFLIENKLVDEQVNVFGDSQLVIQQMNGFWRIRRGMYAKWALETKALAGQFKDLSWNWIPREDNVLADKLSCTSK